MVNNCLECQDTFRGRSDKKFCCDDCRSAYHNKINRDRNNTMRRIHNQLRKNWRILNKMISSQRNECSIHDLAANGFDLRLCTAHKNKGDGKAVFQCYDIEYAIEDHNQIIIFSKNTSQQQLIA